MKRAFMTALILAGAAAAGAQQIGAGIESSPYGYADVLVQSVVPPPPQNGFLSLGLPLGGGIQVFGSAGAGASKRAFRTDPFFDGTEYRAEASARAARIELEARVSKPLVILSAIRPYAGLGLGFYGQNIKSEVLAGGRITALEMKIRGLAQFFSFGIEYRVGSSGSVFLQFKKLGWSGIEAKGEDYYIPESKSRTENDVAPGPGLGDVSVGLAVTLRFGSERSSGGIRIE